MKQYLNNHETEKLTKVGIIAWFVAKAVGLIDITSAILLSAFIVEAGYAFVILLAIGVGLLALKQKWVGKQIRNWYLLKRDGYVTEYYEI